METSNKLKTVNIILSSIGEMPVNSLDGDKTQDVAVAVQTIDEVTAEMQARGWRWNTEYKFAFPRDGNNKVPIPSDVTVIEFSPCRYTDIDPVARGAFFYDRKNQTAVFTKTLTADRIVRLLSFEELPEAARRYITIKSARLVAGRILNSPPLVGFTQQEELVAWQGLVNDELRTTNTNVLNSDVSAAIARRTW
jgi:hypothetical protein